MKVLTTNQKSGRYEKAEKIIFTLKGEPKRYGAICHLQKNETSEDVLRAHTGKHFEIVERSGIDGK